MKKFQKTGRWDWDELVLRERLRDYTAPDMTAEQERRLSLSLSGEIKKVRLSPRKGLTQSLWEQAQYISKVTWFLQAVFLVLALLLFGGLPGEMYLWNVSVMIPFLGVIGIPELTKSFQFDMWELEESCYCHLSKLILMRMVIFGIVDGIFLIFLVAAAGREGVTISHAVLAVAVPFNLSNAVYLCLFQILKRRFNGYILAAAGFMMAGILLGTRRYLLNFSFKTVSLVAVMIGMVSLLTLIASCCRLIKQMEEKNRWSFE